MTIILVALLPAAGAIAGALIAEIWRSPKWLVGAALHGAAGVAIGLVSIELMPRVVETTPAYWIALLFGVGAAISILLSAAVEWLRGDPDEASAGRWKVYGATLADLFSDGLMAGATFAVSSGLGLMLALSQVVANVPGGFATASNFRQRNLKRRARIGAALAYVAPVLVGAVGGFLLLRDLSDAAKNATLAVIAGMLLVTTIEDLIPQADRPGTARWISTAAFVLGFAGITLLSGYVE